VVRERVCRVETDWTYGEKINRGGTDKGKKIKRDHCKNLKRRNVVGDEKERRLGEKQKTDK